MSKIVDYLNRLLFTIMKKYSVALKNDVVNPY